MLKITDKKLNEVHLINRSKISGFLIDGNAFIMLIQTNKGKTSIRFGNLSSRDKKCLAGICSSILEAKIDNPNSFTKDDGLRISKSLTRLYIKDINMIKDNDETSITVLNLDLDDLNFVYFTIPDKHNISNNIMNIHADGFNADIISIRCSENGIDNIEKEYFQIHFATEIVIGERYVE